MNNQQLRHHIAAAAHELKLPLTAQQVHLLTTHVADRTAPNRQPQVQLSRQLMAVLVGLARGEATHETAARLGMSHHTVKTYKARLYKKLGSKTGAQTVATAMNMGILRPSGPTAGAGRSGGGAR